MIEFETDAAEKNLSTLFLHRPETFNDRFTLKGCADSTVVKEVIVFDVFIFERTRKVFFKELQGKGGVTLSHTATRNYNSTFSHGGSVVD